MLDYQQEYKIKMIRKLDRMDSFAVEFFSAKATPPPQPPLVAVMKKAGSTIFSFLTVPELLKLSACSRLTTSLTIDREVLDYQVQRYQPVSTIGRFALSFQSNTTLGLFRRVLCRVVCGTAGMLSIDGNTGRIVMDIGSAFNDEDGFLPSAVPVDDEEGSSIPDMGIQKHLEIASYDEYDDFAPRHPLPREKGHRRGNSLFNSDVEYAATEALLAPPMPDLGGMDLAEAAAQAVAMELMADPAPPTRRMYSAGAAKSLQQFALDALGDEN